MSAAPAELARAVMDALFRRDVDRLIALSDSDVQFQSFFAIGQAGGAYRGHEGIRQYMDELNETFEIVRPDIDDTLEVGDVAVLVGRVHYRGKASGVEDDAPAGWIFTFRNGLLVRFYAFRDPAAVLGGFGR